MVKNLYLNIDDDVSRVVRKITLERSQDLVLVIPKEALIFSDPVNFKLLKKQTDLLQKNVAILTMDLKGRQYAANNGFELKSLDHLRSNGPSMDFGRRKKSVPGLSRPIPGYPQEPVRQVEYPQIPAVQPELDNLSPAPIEQGIQPEQIFQEREMPSEAVARENFTVAGANRQNFNEIISKRDENKKPHRGAKIFFSSLVLVILVFILLTTVILPQADVTVYAHTQNFSRNLPVQVDKKAQGANVQQLIIPGKFLDSDQSQTLQFKTTGMTNSGVKAIGLVQLYNFTGKTLKLGVNTTTLLVGNNLYHFTKDVTGLKPSKYISTDSQTVDPKSLIAPVSIVADQPGESYNLPTGTRFDLNNQVLGANTLLYAVNVNNIDGGSSVLNPVISQQDLDQAQKTLSDNVFKAASQQLQNSSGFMLTATGTTVQIKNVSFDHKLDDSAAEFSGTIAAHLTGLAYDPKVLKSLIEQRIGLTLNSDQYLVTGQSEVISADYKTSSLDFSAGTGILNVSASGILASKIDNAGIAGAINGKNALEVKEYLMSNPNIDSAGVTFKPFWVKTVPRLSGKVYIHDWLAPVPQS